MCVVSSSLCYCCCYQPLMWCIFLSTCYQLFSTVYQLFINSLSTFINFYQLVLSTFFLSTFVINFFINCFINFLSTVSQLFINFLSTVSQLFINLEEMITFDICETLFALLQGHTMFLHLPAVAGPESQLSYSFQLSLCLLPRTSGRDAP